MVEDTDHESEEEETFTGLAKFHAQSKEIANRQSRLDNKLATREQTVESLKTTKTQGGNPPSIQEAGAKRQDGRANVQIESGKSPRSFEEARAKGATAATQEDGLTELKNGIRQLEELNAKMEEVSARDLGTTNRKPFPERPESHRDDVMMAKVYTQTMDIAQFTRRNIVEVGDSSMEEVAALRTEDAAAMMRSEACQVLQTPGMKKRATKFLLEAWLNWLIASLITLESLQHLDDMDHGEFRHANGPFDSLIRGLEERK